MFPGKLHDVEAWQGYYLNPLYSVVFLDAIHYIKIEQNNKYQIEVVQVVLYVLLRLYHGE